MVAGRRALHLITIVMMLISMLGNSITTVLAAPNAQWNPNQWDFGPVTIGTTSTKTFALQNTGTTTVSVTTSATTTNQTGPGTFTIVANNCNAPIALAINATCTVDVRFDPVNINPVTPQSTGTLQVAVDNGIGTLTASLQGFGVTTGLTVTPGSLVFGNQQVGTTSPAQTITLRNTTAGPVNISNISSSPAPFTIQTDSCSGQTLAQNVTCTLTVTFKPVGTGPASASIPITSTATPNTNNIALSGIGIDPLPITSPSSLNFGNIPLGSASAPQTVSLVNNTGQSIIVNALPILEDPFFLAQFFRNSTTCVVGASIPNGGSCSAEILFTPVTANGPGPWLDKVLFSTTAGGATQTLSATVFGVATVGSLTISPGTVNFGSITVGQPSASQSVTITNLGGGDATITGAISSANFTGGDAANFSVLASACPVGPAPLAAGASCTVTLRFTPSAAGNRSSALQVPTSSGILQVTVNGVGVNVPATAPILSVSPGALNFGSVQQAQPSLGQVITIANSGTAPLTLTSAGIVGGDTGDFASIANTCSFPLAPGASCNVTLRFTPGATGNRTSSYQIVTNAGTALVLLTGIGTAAPVTAPGIAFNPAAVSFGNQQVGSTSGAHTVTVTNTGTANLIVTAVALSGGNVGDFSAPTTNCLTTLAPGAQCQLSLTFTPTATGNRATSILVTDNVPSAGSTQIIPVNGVGVAADVTIAPTTVNFGSVQQGQPAGAQTATITNLGSGPITITGAITNANITGANSADFSVIASGCPVGPTALAAGDSCTVSLGFTPGGVGNRNASLQVTTSAGVVLSALTGAGTNAPVTNPFASLSAGTLSFGNQTVNTQSAAQAVTITNVGTANLVFSAAPNIGGGDASQFQIVTDGCGATTLIPGASCTVTVRFFPGTLGQKSSTLVFTSNISGLYSIVNLTGNSVAAAATAPAIGFNPAAVAFGAQTVSTTSGAQTVTVTNTGTANLAITAVTTSGGDAAQFPGVGTNCVTLSPLAPGAQCSITLTFAPTGTGNRATSILVTDNVAGGSTHIIPVSGLGIAAAVTAPVASVNPISVDFGNTQVATFSGAQAITLTNTGTANLVLSAIPALVGADAGSFAIVADGCTTSTLTPGASCTVTVRFGPGTVGNKSAALSFADNASGSPHLANLVGNGVAAPVTAPFASLSTGALGFGDQQVNTRSGAQAITLTNTGTANLVLSGAPTLFGGDTSQFEIVADGCWAGGPGTLPPGTACTVTVRFFPGTTGQKSSALRFVSNAPGGNQLVNLTGNGVAALVAAPAISFAPAAVAFGPQTVGTTSGAQTVIVTNTGTANLIISAVSVSGGNAAEFPGAGTNCTTLAPGAQCLITLTFAPTGTGNRATSILVTDNVAGGSTHIIPVSGVGVAPGSPSANVNPGNVAFGDVQVSTFSGAQAITLTNSGSGNLTFSAAPALVGADAGSFAIVVDGCGTSTLTPGSSCTVTVRFGPGTAGNKSAALSFADNASGSPHLANLTGNGVAAPVLIPFAALTAGTLSFGNQTVNTQSAAQAVTITNTGTANLVFSAAPSIGGGDASQFQIVTDGCGATTLIPGASCTVTVRFFPGTLGQKSSTLVFTSNISGLYSIVNLTGNGVAAGVPAVTLAPTAIAFGNVPVGTSAVQIVTATNSGTGPLVFGTVVVAGAGYTESGDTCQGVTLNPGQSCTVAVVFAPGTATALAGTLTFTDNAPTGGSSQVVNLRGFGVSSVLAFTPPPVNFGNVTIGSGSTLGLLVTNLGGGPITISAVGGLAAPFSIQGDTCTGLTLAPNASCVLDIKFQPTLAGYAFDSVTVTTGAGTYSAVVDGTGVAAPTPAITITPGAIAFGNVPVGSTVSQVVTVKNTGGAAFTINAGGVTGLVAPLAISGNGCNGTVLNPNDTCTFTVTFSPTAAGPASGTVSIASTLSGSPHSIGVSGTGVSSVLSFNPNPLNFGSIALGSTSTLGVLVTNTGGGPLPILSVTEQMAGAPITIVSTTCTGLTLAPGASCAVVVQFSPTALGAATDQLQVNGPGPVLIAAASVVGNGVPAPTPALSLSPAVLNFGNVGVGASAAQTVTVSNTGGAAFTLSNPALTGAGAPFTVSGNGCNGVTLTPGQSCTFAVTFAPTATGPAIVALSIASTAPGSPHILNASGTGVTNVLSVTPAPLNFGNVAVGTSATLGATVTNTGSGPVAITTVTELIGGGPITIVSTSCTGATLAPGASCVVNVQFSPVAAGNFTDQLQINGPALLASSAVVGVGVTAPVPTVTIQPTSLDFGDVQVNTTSPALPLTVTNTGNAPLNITTLGTSNAVYALSANGCAGATLQPGQSCTVGVTFTPAAVGQTIATLTINDNAGGVASSQLVSLTGNGISVGLAVTPGSIDFGNQQLNTASAVQTVTVKNVGLGTITINTIVASASFAIFADTCVGQTLAAGDSCSIGVRFTPTATGQITGTLAFTTTGPDPVVSLLGNGITAQLSVTPASLNFGNQAINTPGAAQTVTVKNIGTGTVTITNTAPLIGPDAAHFEIVTDTCQPSGNDVTLAAGQECTISVRFLPTTIGPKNALLQITSNAPTAGSNVTVGLSGFGVTSGPAISFNPSALNFGSIPVNTSATRTLTVTNSGTAPLVFNTVGPAGVVLAGSAFYTLTGNGCTGATLLPGESCTVGATFAPTAVGVANATLTFNSNAPATPHVVNATGIGTSAVFTFDPLALNFGNVQVNTTSTLSVLVTNRTGGPASITGIAGVVAPFTLVGDSCTGILLPDGASCVLTFTFAPTIVGYAFNTVTLNLSTGGSVTLALTGTGVPQPTPLISITPASLDFGYVQVGQTTPARTVTVTNVGTVAVTMTSAIVAGAGFAEATDTCQGQVLQPGQSCTVGVTFTPGSAVALSGTLTFTDSAPSSTQIVPLFGNGITAGLSIAPASLNFGNVQVGTTSAAQTVTVTNTGSGPVNITNFGLIGTDAGQYEVVANTCITAGFPATLPPGASCTFAVRFKPTTPGAKIAAQLSLTSTAAGNPQTVGLSGVGVTPAFNLSANGLDFGNVVVGQTSPTQTVTLTNSTNGPLTIVSVVSSAPATYLVTGDTCVGQTIPAGATCQIGVQFRPAAVGANNQTLTITYNNGQGGTATVAVNLTGNGISGALGVSPNALNFGYQQVGTTSAAQVVTITGNPSGSVQIVSAVVVTGAHFAETGDTCQAQTLAPNGTCTVGVTFTPTSPGQKNDILRITYNAGSGNQTVDIALSGIGVSPALSLSANGLDFGYQQVNTTSPVQTITVTNSTNGPLTLGNPSIPGGSPFLESGDNCINLTLAPNQSCTIGVQFRPTTTGPLFDTLTIPYDNGQAITVNVGVNLTGIGITAQVSVTPASLDFGNLQLGSTSPAQTVTVKNVGAGPVSITSTTIAGEFSIVANTCFTAGNGATLPPGASCTIGVVFQPLTPAGNKTGILTIANSASGTPQTVSLTGVGVTPAISVTPASLIFGPQQIGIDSPAQLVTVKNIGTGPVTVGAIAAAANPPFRIVDNQCTGLLLTVNQTCTFAIVFNSASAGTFNGAVSITTDSPVANTVTTVALVGTATNASLYVNTPTVDFGTVQVGTTAGPKTVTLTNVGSGPILIGSGPTLGGANAADFALSTGCTGTTLFPSQSCTVEITFTPSAVGTRSATITVTDNASGSPQIIALTGVGINPGFTLSATGLDFGYRQVGTFSPVQTVRLTNNSTGPLTIGTVSLGLGTHFQITGENCANRTFGPGQFCEIGVLFRPTAVGQQNDTLQVVYNGGAGNVTLGVTLTGIGITAQLAVTPPSLDFGNVQVGTTSAAKTVTVKNVGSGPVTITGTTIAGEFSIVANTCFTAGNGATLPPNAECTIGVVFQPVAPAGSKTGALTIADTASGTAQVVSLTGVGITPNLSITPASLAFGVWQVGTTSPAQTVTVTNIGVGPVTITAASITTGGTDFTIVANTCFTAGNGATLPVGGTCQISVIFNPIAPAGAKSGTLTITDSASGTPQTISLTGVGITAQVSVTPASLDFGNVQVGAVSPAQVVTVTNVGAGPVSITTILPGGTNPGDFELLDNTCFSAGNGATLPPGGTCTVAVRFKPGTTGAKSATLAITDSASGTPQVVGLSGVGISAAISLAPASLDFGSQQVGTTSPAKTVTITNTSNGPLTVTGIVSSSGEFQVVGNTCGSQTIAPNATCTISVVFAPTSAGAKAATLTIADSTNTGSHLVSLTGVGVTAALNVSPASLDFGNQTTNTTSPARTVTVTNTGSGPVSLTAFALTGIDGSQFEIVTNNCLGATLPANGTCTISIVFKPTSAGAKSAALSITNSAAATPQTVSLTGNGITGALSFQPVAANFGPQQINTTATQAIVVTNTSGAPISFSAVALGGASSPAFSLTGNTCTGATLPAGGSCTVGVNFTPATIGQHFGSVVFTDTAAGSPHTVTLSGQGTGTPTPVIGINPPSLDFGNQQVGTTSPARTVTITNTGPAALVISSAAITVGGADFTKIADTCSGQTVNPGESCTVSVVFNPSAAGPRAGLLTLSDNVPNANSIQTISLTGVGVTGALTVTPSALDFGSQQVGTTSAVQTFTARNTGAANLTISNLAVSGGDFLITGANCTGVTLVPGATCQIGIVFKPTTIGVRNATLTISHDGPGSPTTVSLTGLGLSAAIGLSVGSLDFGPQQVNTSSPAQTATITNKSNGPLQISTIVSDNPEFQVFANTCASIVLAPNATCTVSVVFRPSQTGQRTGTLTISDSTATGSHTISLTGLAVTSAVTLSAANFQFGSHQVGTTSPAQTLTVRNSGESALSITAVLISGPNSSDFIKSGDTCLGATLAPGQECQVSVSFSPSAGGNRSATLQINDTAPGSPRTVILGGIGITPVVTFSPLSLDFGQVAVGATSAAQTVTLINTSDGPLTISSVTTSNAAFRKGADTCILATLPAGGSCQVSITFQPTAVGQASGNLVFNTTVGSGQQSISLTGLGVTAATPTLGLSTTTLSFDAQQVGAQSVTQVLTLTNTGNVPVSISSVALNGTNPGDFVLYGNSCVGATLAVNGTCQIGVAFKPTGTGNRNATLRIEDTAAGSPRIVALLGIGIVPTLSVSVPSLEFGAIQVGATSAPQTVTLTNTTSSSVMLTNILINGANPNDFTKTLDTCASATLAPAASCSVTVRFTPQAGGTRGAGLLILIGGGSPLTIGLNGLGVTAQATFDPATLSFGTQPVTTMSNFQTVRLTNGGSGVLTIASISLIGGDTGDFVVAGDTCSGGTLGPNGSCRVNVAFRPTTTGNRFANLAFSTNVGTGTQTVALQGVGATTPTPAIQLSVQGLTFGPQQVGTQSAIQSITVTNSGTANLVISNTLVTGPTATDFLKTGDNCAGVTLAPGASCSLGIRFAPSASSNRLATLAFTTNAGTGSQSVSLVGLGITATVYLSATSLQFGQQTVGVSSAGQMLQITNTGNGPLVIQSVVIVGVNTGDFIKNGDTCAGATIAPGLGCTVGVIFRPLAVGSKSASLLVNDNAPGAPREIALTGEGTQGLTPSVGLSASSFNFGSVQVGSTSSGQVLLVTNTGAAPLRITALVINGANSSDFVKSGDTCANSTIAPQKFCSVGLLFRPTAAGVRNGTLFMVDDTAGSPREINLTGVGITGAVGLSAASLNFGGQTIGVQSATQNFTVTNTGQGALTLGPITVVGANAGDWKLLANTCENATVPSGATCQVGIAFKPTAEGDRSATLAVTNTAAGSVHNVALLGTGLLPQPRYTVTLTLSSLGCNGSILPAGGTYVAGDTVVLTVTPLPDYLFLGWRVNELGAGWANPLDLTVTRDTRVEATCVPKIAFTDTQTNPYLQAIYELTARGIIRGYTSDGCVARGKTAPCFGPDDTTLRAQMAALIARAMGWDLENHGNGFKDGVGIDPNLWRNVGTLAYYGVAFGYGDGNFGPNDNVTQAQTISFITRAMVVKGYWQRQPDNAALYPDVPASSGHRIDIATYVHYVGAIPGTGSPNGAFAWSAPATRAWFSQTLWLALNSYFGRDVDGRGGFVP